MEFYPNGMFFNLNKICIIIIKKIYTFGQRLYENIFKWAFHVTGGMFMLFI